MRITADDFETELAPLEQEIWWNSPSLPQEEVKFSLEEEAAYQEYMNTRLNELQRIMDNVPVGTEELIADKQTKAQYAIVVNQDNSITIWPIINTPTKQEPFVFPPNSENYPDWNTSFNNLFPNGVESIIRDTKALASPQQALDIIQ